MAKKSKEQQLLNIVKTAIDQFGAANLGVAIDDEEDTFYVYFHSENDGYPVAETEILSDDVDLGSLCEKLDELDIGYDF